MGIYGVISTWEIVGVLRGYFIWGSFPRNAKPKVSASFHECSELRAWMILANYNEKTDELISHLK